jgi:FOG: Ankyrin repeat
MVCFSEVCDIEALIEKLGPEALSSRDEWGYTPAHWAALDGNVEVMRYLVERSAPVDLSCLGTQGPRPIHWSCRKGHTAVVQVLLSVRNFFLKILLKLTKLSKMSGILWDVMQCW